MLLADEFGIEHTTLQVDHAAEGPLLQFPSRAENPSISAPRRAERRPLQDRTK
jgi:hypothetical protein